MAWLYNPETMPDDLLKAHQDSDTYIEECLYGRDYKDDTRRLEHLFAMYANMRSRQDTPLLSKNKHAKRVSN